jgi:hypothetical protein
VSLLLSIGQPRSSLLKCSIPGQLFSGYVPCYVDPMHAYRDMAGTRGATSAEYFLSSNYAVIFLHRLHSLRPFSRHYSHSLNPFLDLLSITPNPPSSSNSITVSPEHSTKLLPILQAYHDAQQQGTLLSIDFQTVNEYLWLLRAVTGVMAPLGRRGMFYLAAAVSDFFLPEDKTVSLVLNLSHPYQERAWSVERNRPRTVQKRG